MDVVSTTDRRKQLGLWLWLAFSAAWVVLAAVYWTEGRPISAILGTLIAASAWGVLVVRWRALVRERSSG